MTTYACVKNGAVASVGAIPTAWTFADGSSISGFNLRPELWAAEGWLPITEVRPTYDPATQQLTGPAYTVGASSVTATYTAVPRPVTAVNLDALRTAAAAAVTANQTFAGTCAANRTTVVNAKAQAAAAQTATVTTFPQTQTYIQGIATQLNNVDGALLFLADQVSALSLQNNQLIRLVLGLLDATN